MIFFIKPSETQATTQRCSREREVERDRGTQRPIEDRVYWGTSRYAVFYTEVEGEVGVKQWRPILVDDVSGSDAAEVA